MHIDVLIGKNLGLGSENLEIFEPEEERVKKQIMITIDKQIEFIETCICLEKDKWIIYNAILETLHKSKCNALPLQLDRKKCPSCGKSFIVKNKHQECCSANCRVNLHRSKKRLENFNKQVEQILRAKNPNAKFLIEQIITSSRKCPFIVHYNGIQYKSDSTRNLLSQLKKINTKNTHA
jgi:hypothetical protein